MTREEAESFVVEAVALAMARDGSSGGVIRTVTLDKDGPKFRYASGIPCSFAAGTCGMSAPVCVQSFCHPFW